MTTVIFMSIQATTIFFVMFYDFLRKRKIRSKNFIFPSLTPQSINIKDSQIRTYTEGKSLYKEMLEDISNAKETIMFETYIWKDDIVGREFKRELIKAARRGIKVYVVFDGFGNFIVPRIFKRFPKIPNLHVLEFPFFRHGLLTLNPRKTGRDHRKILVVDSEIAYIGGYNIGALYRDKWRDTHIRIKGSTVWELENAFINFWNTFSKKNSHKIPDLGAKEWDSNIRVAVNNPNRLLFPVRGLYIDAFDRATKNIWITQAYFVPDKEITEGLIKAARRGVDVKILMPEKSNHIVADWVASSYFDTLLNAGVEIWLYKNTMIHAKTCTVDGRWSTVGTANIDRLSLMGNFEINVQIWSKRFANCMQNIFIKDLTNCRRLTLEERNNVRIMERITEKILRPLGFII
ncbi:phosphatidylserine/phosphatidylglycerophosphate/cardiolipin synthase family protein [Actinomyces sp. zg-332]|uniref:phospholipase D-like domain-containing protein n=1 Tax=Actinomyces sp. zg-332 TaxID=2708340 RepID=UPI00142244B6|nr:phospholipase D-like domain-containing protein [Actinomyces sp. zg-332]QPK93908.1 phosphatidylserine/phosphatidylglycerophosphate/cardiolipin synthase family protein [Actinomyces sp. zg-332]